MVFPESYFTQRNDIRKTSILDFFHKYLIINLLERLEGRIQDVLELPDLLFKDLKRVIVG